MRSGFDQYYDEAVEPGRRERAFAWATAIGLQDVDGLKPSKHLYKVARRHIEGEITQEEARRIVDEYYETKDGHDLPRDQEEADKVSARMIAIIESPSFVFSPEYYAGLHGRIFEDVFPHAGKFREVELTKHEEVLNGASVDYAPSFMIKTQLNAEFNRERHFVYKGISEDGFVRHFAAFVSTIWQIHPFREGNTRTTALFAIKYLRSKGFPVTNDLFARESWYFRNALVRANYENTQLDVVKEPVFLEEFFKVLLGGVDIELKNRFMRIGFEYGTKAAESVANMHRRESGTQSNNDVINDVIKDAIKLNESEEKAIRAILRNSHISAATLSKEIGVMPRQAQRIMAALKEKAGLRRRGARKNGEWYFEQLQQGFQRRESSVLPEGKA